MNPCNVEPTAEKIDEMANAAHDLSAELCYIADCLRVQKDFSYAADALNAVLNFVISARLDLMVTRPVRELTK